jgi:hypothetical protein
MMIKRYLSLNLGTLGENGEFLSMVATLVANRGFWNLVMGSRKH